MKGAHPPFQSNWKTWFEIPKMGVNARKPPIQPHAGYGSHFEERFRLLLTRNTLIQFFFGLMIELFVPPVGFSSAFPKFVGTMDDLFFGGCSHRVLSSLRTVNGRRPIGHCSDEEGQRALHRSPSSWDCPAPREIPSPANTMRGPISRFRGRGHIVLTFAPILTNREMVVTSTLALSRAT
jgi:hypothetical protein